MERILITGAAGFIGFHIAHRLLLEGKSITGIDCMLDNNDLWIKKIRLKILSRFKNFKFCNKTIGKESLLKERERYDLIIHMAAVSGIERFEKDKDTAERLTLEASEAVSAYAKQYNIPVLYASSSSIYGNLKKHRFAESDDKLEPLSSYARTKIKIEKIFGETDSLSVGLRFFTIYGEYGRPDMAYFRFARQLTSNEPLVIYGRGIKRDFTYIKDVVNSVILIIKNLKTFEKLKERPIVNIGHGRAVKLEKMVYLLGRYLKKKPIIIYKRPRKFDMPYTCSDNSLLKKITGYTPSTDIESGLKHFTEWFQNTIPYD